MNNNNKYYFNKYYKEYKCNYKYVNGQNGLELKLQQ